MKFTLITAILLGWVCIGKSDDDRVMDCCLTVTNTRIPVENIVYYDIQEKHTICPVRAVKFYTKRDKIICSDPDSRWAKRAMEVVNGRWNLDGPPATCCLTVTRTRIPVKDILDYYIQDGLSCPLRAVRFRTTKNIIICSDPEDSWAKKAINDVNERRTQTEEPSKEPFVYDTSKATLIPTKATTQWTTEGDGLPKSCCNNVTRNTGPVKSILKYHIKSRSRKGLRKFQAAVWKRKQ